MLHQEVTITVRYIHNNEICCLMLGLLFSNPCHLQVISSPKYSGFSKESHGSTQSEAVINGVQNTDILSSAYRESFNNLNLQSGEIYQELFQGEVNGTKHSVSTAVGLLSTPRIHASESVNGRRELLSDLGMQTPQTIVQPFHSPLSGSISSLRSKRQQLFLDAFVPLQSTLMNTPDGKEPPSSLKMKLTQHGDIISAIKIHKSTAYKSPIIVHSKLAVSEKVPMPHELERTLENNNDGYSALGVSVGNKKDSQLSDAQEANAPSVGSPLTYSGSPTVSNLSLLTNTRKNDDVARTVKLMAGISSVQLSQSEKSMEGNLLGFDTPTEQANRPNACRSLAEPTVLKESLTTVDTPQCTISSPLGKLGDEPSSTPTGCSSPSLDGTACLSSLIGKNRLQESKSVLISNSDKVSKLESPEALKKNDGPLSKLQEQIEGSKNFDHGKQDRDIVIEDTMMTARKRLLVEERASSIDSLLKDINKLHAAVDMSEVIVFHTCFPFMIYFCILSTLSLFLLG